MDKIAHIAQERPLLFVLLIILSWFFIGSVLVVASAMFFGISIVEDLPQITGTLGATLILLVIANRLGWLSEIRITRFGSWRVWLLVLGLCLYFIPAYWFAFFGDISFDIGIFTRSDVARQILLRDGIVGLVEETLFRGIILYVLVRAWGYTRRGIWVAVIVQGLFFGLFHILQVTVGMSIESVLVNIVSSAVSGIWWAALVLAFDSLWPAIVLHAASNSAVLVKGLTSAYIEPGTWAYTRAILLEIPLLIFGFWLLTRLPLHPESPAQSVQQEEGNPPD